MPLPGTYVIVMPEFQERNLDWFPRMRAMSLVSSDSEGEQNELRNLQEKLESTMKLVSNLSNQLSELKEQVRDFQMMQTGYEFTQSLYVFTNFGKPEMSWSHLISVTEWKT